MLGAAMRADRATLAEAVATVARALNANNVGRVAPERVAFPLGPGTADARCRSSHDATCWRGSGFRDTPAIRAFFQSRADMADGDPAKKYRVPQFLATSFSTEVADRFIGLSWPFVVAPGAFVNALVRWRVRLDPDPARRCRHVNLVTEAHVDDEIEYLFAAFSVFSVVAVHWSPTPQEPATPHEITILAAYDNAQEDESLPLAPAPTRNSRPVGPTSRSDIDRAAAASAGSAGRTATTAINCASYRPARISSSGQTSRPR